MMRAHGGKVRVESSWGKGSTFTLEFPSLNEP
jgi:signal transduction histidine kinase